MGFDPVTQAEKIIEAESTTLHAIHDLLEMQVKAIQSLASIDHQQAHEAFDIYMKIMMRAAEKAGETPQEFMEGVSEKRQLMMMGMIIGALLSGNELDFELNTDKYRDAKD